MSVLTAFKTIGQTLKVLTVTEGVLELTESIEHHEETEMGDETNEPRTLIEEIELEGKYLAKRVKELIHEGNVRTLRVKDQKDKYLLEIPLTVGVVAGGVLAATAPMWIALGTLAATLARLTIEVERVVEDEQPEPESKDEA